MKKLAIVLMAGVRFLAGKPKVFGRRVRGRLWAGGRILGWWILGRVVDFRACGRFWGGLVDFRRVVDS